MCAESSVRKGGEGMCWTDEKECMCERERERRGHVLDRREREGEKERRGHIAVMLRENGRGKGRHVL